MTRLDVRSSIARYAIAVALTVLAVIANKFLDRFMEPSAAPLLFAGVLLAAWQGGWGPGLLATVLATLADDYFFIAPIGSIEFDTPVRIRLIVFLLVSTLTSYLTAQRRQAVAARDQSLIKERDARASAEDANRIKDQFLAVTSHELRSPLGGIAMWTDVLIGEELPPEAREAADSIQRCSQSLQRLIEDLMDVARLESGKMRIEPERVELAAAVRHAVTTVETARAARGITLTSDIEAAASTAAVRVDPARFQQILTNLLTNSLKFTPPGGNVRASVEVTSATNAGPTDAGPVDALPWAVIRVSDNGRGIEPDHLGQIFGRFWQAGQAKSTAGDGLGLGLAIVHDLVKMHGGRIHAESLGVGQGATFVIELPLLRE